MCLRKARVLNTKPLKLQVYKNLAINLSLTKCKIALSKLMWLKFSPALCKLSFQFSPLLVTPCKLSF